MEKTLITAEQAKTIQEASKKQFDDIAGTIKSMAEGGYNYASFELRRIKDPEGYKAKLIEAGYTVNISETNFSINW
jgi:hypothetical protein